MTESSERETRLAGGPDDNPYRRRRDESRFSDIPWSAYFFYYNPRANPPRFDRYYYPSLHGPIRRGALRTLITQLALNARLPDRSRQNPAPYAQGTRSIWTRKSYFIVLVDNPNFKFENPAFTVYAEAKDNGNWVPIPNHNFFDAEHFLRVRLEDATGTEYVPAICVTNHMKRADERDLYPQEEERYIFRFNPGSRVRPMRDDGGMNLGPPVPPP